MKGGGGEKRIEEVDCEVRRQLNNLHCLSKVEGLLPEPFLPIEGDSGLKVTIKETYKQVSIDE